MEKDNFDNVKWVIEMNLKVILNNLSDFIHCVNEYSLDINIYSVAKLFNNTNMLYHKILNGEIDLRYIKDPDKFILENLEDYEEVFKFMESNKETIINKRKELEEKNVDKSK